MGSDCTSSWSLHTFTIKVAIECIGMVLCFEYSLTQVQGFCMLLYQIVVIDYRLHLVLPFCQIKSILNLFVPVLRALTMRVS